MGELDNGSFPERKVEDFYFKQLKKFRVFDSPEGLPLDKSHLLAVSNKFGVCFVGCPTGLRIIKTEIIGKKNKEDERNINAVVSDYLSIFIDIGGPVRHVGVSCDNMTLSVCYEQGNNIMFRVYDIPAICSQNGSQKMLEVALSTDAGISLVNLLWNPAVHNSFATCFSNGSVAMWEMTDTKINKTGVLPISTRATAICWSPKGKQIVVGHKDGHLTQFSPTLEVKKETPPPEIFKDTPHQVTSICWISAAVFLNVYTTEEEGDVPQCVLVCNQTKMSPKQIINFDDVYFGINEDREKGFYTMHLQEWNVTLSVSCNAFEVAVFGNEKKWEKWTFEDEHRAEMPLTAESEETYPMGMAIDLTSNIPIVENELSYPPAPILLLLSTDGLLCPFYMVNKNPKAKHDIVKAAEPLPSPGQRSKITGAAAPPRSKTLQQEGARQQQPPLFQLPQQQQQLRLQQSQPKQSTTQHENLEVSVSKCISEEDHNIEIQDAKKNLLSSFEILEDARIRHHRAKDPRYLHLLKSRGLDPINANKMKTIRELYIHLDKTLSEVNLALDEELNKENESRNKLQRPAMDAIYRTLKSHHTVAQEQSVKLDKIAEKMKRKKLLSPSWKKPFASSAMSSRENMNELSSVEGSIKGHDLETTTHSPVKIPGTSLFGVNTSSTGFKPPCGSGSLSTFGSPSSSCGFSGGSFSKGTVNVASSGFAVGGAGSSGFGGSPSPSFGGALAFGSCHSFGGPPAFGSAPVFGSSPQIGNVSPGGVFGGSQGTSSFGNVSGSPTFGALARQSTTPSFGNVAQEAQQAQPGFGGFGQQSTGFGGFGSPGGGTGGSTFGGSSSTSFNQWR